MTILVDAGVVSAVGAGVAAVSAYVVQQVRSAPTVEQQIVAEMRRQEQLQRDHARLQPGEMVLPVAPRLSEQEARVEARLRRFNIPSSQRAELIRTLDPDVVVPLNDAVLQRLIDGAIPAHVSSVTRRGGLTVETMGSVTMEAAGRAMHRALVGSGAPLPCGYCSVLDRPCACRR